MLVSASRSAFAALLLIVAAPGHAQTLLVNGGFDGGTLSPWETTGPDAVWNDLDYEGDKKSGSARLINANANGSTVNYALWQCVILDRPGRVFRLRFAAFIGAGQAAGSVSASLFYGAAQVNECGEATSGEGYFAATVGAWQIRDGILVLPYTLPAGSAVEVWLNVYKEGPGGSIAGYMDNLLLENDGLLVDGFEPLP